MGLFNFWRGSETVTITDWLGNKIDNAEIADEIDEKLKKAAVKEMALRTAVGLIADLVSGCEVQVFRDGKPVKNTLWYLLNISANPNETAAHAMSQWISRMYYSKEGESIMFPLANHLYVADSFAVEDNQTKGNLYSGISVGELNVKRTFRADKLMSLKQNDPRIGKLIAEVYDAYGDLLLYSKEAYAQGAGEKYSVQLGSRASGDIEQQKQYMTEVESRLKSFVDARSAVLPLNRDQSIQRLSSASASTSGSSDYPALRKEVYAVVAEVLHLPAGLLEGNITSVDQVLGQALTFAIDPLVHMIDQELTRKNFTPEEVTDGGCYVKIDTTSIKHIDVIDVATNIDKLIASGFMSIDEVRHRCDVAELGEDWSKKHYITKNYEDINANTTTEGGE